MRKTVDITGVGRDQSKVFRITEMSAFKAEKWAMRALWAIAGSGVEIPDNIMSAPLAKLFEIGFAALAKVPFDLVNPLMSEIMECISVVTPDGTNRKLLSDDIEEYMTILHLRKEVLKLHISFFTQDEPQILD